jgi:hypothetical protein
VHLTGLAQYPTEYILGFCGQNIDLDLFMKELHPGELCFQFVDIDDPSFK